MLAARIAKYTKHAAAPAVDERPGCTYGAVTRQRVADQAEIIGRVEAKVNALLGGLALFLAIEILKAIRP